MDALTLQSMSLYSYLTSCALKHCVFFLKKEAISQSVATRDTRKPEARDAWGTGMQEERGRATRNTWSTDMQEQWGEATVVGPLSVAQLKSQQGGVGGGPAFQGCSRGNRPKDTAWDPWEEGDHKARVNRDKNH